MPTRIKEFKLNVASGAEIVLGVLEVSKRSAVTIREVQFVPGPDGEIEGWYDNERVDDITTETARDVNGWPYVKADVLPGGSKYIFVGKNNDAGAQDMAVNVVYEEAPAA